MLSQFEFPEDTLAVNKNNAGSKCSSDNTNLAKHDLETSQTNGARVLKLNEDVPRNIELLVRNNENIPNNSKENVVKSANNVISPKHTKRKMINSYFDHKSKRKFPGPAGLLTGGFEENENICQIELLSQVKGNQSSYNKYNICKHNLLNKFKNVSYSFRMLILPKTI